MIMWRGTKPLLLRLLFRNIIMEVKYKSLTDELTFLDIKEGLVTKNKIYCDWKYLDKRYNCGLLVCISLVNLLKTENGNYCVVLWDDRNLWQGYIEREYISDATIHSEDIFEKTMYKIDVPTPLEAIEILVGHLEEIVGKEGF